MRRAALILALSALPAAAEPVALTVDRPFGPLEGTLEVTAGPAQAAALILPGSGPTDRDGNSALGLRTDAYRLMAEALAGAGIATARIDKRGIGASAGEADAVSLAAYRADTADWIAAIRAETGAPCVWLIGHSEGGLLALDAASLPDVCGLVLLAAPGRDLGALMRDQVAGNPALSPALPAFDAALTALALGAEPDTSGLPPMLAAIFAPATRGYLRELVTTDPAALMAATDRPVLILDGDADIQVPPTEADRLAAARPDADRLTLPGLTHTLKRASPADDSPAALTAASLATYADPSLPLHDGLLPAIAGFILTPR
jgi:pimeloyl-ACP methyl ester carboxylesterase